MGNNEDAKKERAKVGLFDYLFLLLLLLTTISISIAFQFSSSNASKADKNEGTDTNSYTVAFNVNIEGETMESLSIKDGELITEPTAPTKEGYTFGGWYRDEACQYRWNFATDKVTSNTTLYPKWTLNAYTVDFDLQDHGAHIDSQTINYNCKVTKPTDPTENGYTFGGWYKEKACENAWNFTENKVTANTTLYAKWTINSYAVTFNMKEHGAQIDPLSVNYGGKGTAPTAPTETGYTFGGWFKDEACEYKWDFATNTVTADTTLYAKWTADAVADNYTVTFNMKGHGSQIDSRVVIEGSLLTAPTAPTESGYTFGGWYKDTSCAYRWDFASDVVTTNTTLYAKWTADIVVPTYTVTFDTDSIGTSVSPQTVSEGELVPVQADPTDTDYVFDGWYKDTEYEYRWDFASDVVTADITLHAKWLFKHTISFNLNPSKVPAVCKGVGHNMYEYDYVTNCPAPIQVAYGKLAKEQEPDYYLCGSGVDDSEFQGWYRDAETTIPWSWNYDLVTGDITLYAGWDVNHIK